MEGSSKKAKFDLKLYDSEAVSSAKIELLTERLLTSDPSLSRGEISYASRNRMSSCNC
jgi:hypothetical protein